MAYAVYRYSRTQLGKVKRFVRRMRRTLAHPIVFRRVVHIERNPSVSGVYTAWKIPYDLAAVEKAQAAFGETLAEPNRELFVWGVKNARVKIVNGYVAQENGKLLAESVFAPKTLLEVSKKNEFALEPAIRLSGGPYTIMGFQWTNYYHWFVDSLTRLHSLTQLNLAEPLILLVPQDLAPYKALSLEWCLPANMVVQPVAESNWISVEKLFFPSHIRTRTNDYLPPDYIHFLRSAVFKHVPLTPLQKPGRRLYISRALASCRRVTNETDVITLLNGYGFEVIQAETIPLEEQVRLFRAAEVVVAPHGAGLTNILFSEALTLVEMMGNLQGEMWCYRRLASVLGHSYHHLPAVQAYKNADMRVDIASLEKKVIEIGLLNLS